MRSPMKNFWELSEMVNRTLPEWKQRNMLCDLLFQEFAKMKGRDLAPYLTEFGLDMKEQPAWVLQIRFPILADVFNPNLCDAEDDGPGRIKPNGAIKNKV